MSTEPDTSAMPQTLHSVESAVPTDVVVPSATVAQKVSFGLSQWKKFWFDPTDPLMLSIIRLLTAGMLFYNLCVWTLDFDAFFSPDGLQPLATIQKLYEGSPVFSFWFYVSEPWLWTAHLCSLGIVFLFFTGTATRATSIFSYLITISYSQRVPIANFGLDQILGLLCLYLAVGPSGACLSVDSLVRRFRSRRRTGPVDADASVVRRKSSSARVSLRLIQIHLCVIYFWAGFAKLKGDTWFTGEAMWNVIANLEYQTTDLTWMAHVPWLPYLVAHVTVIWELFFCALVWNRTLRPVMLLIGTGMHVGIGAFLGMWTFGLTMTFCYFAFSDPAVWRHNWNLWFGRLRPSTTGDGVGRAATAVTTVNAADTVSARPARRPFPGLVRTAAVADSQNTASNSHSLPTLGTNSSESAASISIRGLPGTELLIVALRERHRQSLRTYFRNHDVPCRSAATVETSLSMAAASPPAAILVMASELSGDQLICLLDDLQDIGAAPVLVVVSATQMADVLNLRSPVSFLRAPVTLKEIHEELIQAMWKGHDGFKQTAVVPRQTGQ